MSDEYQLQITRKGDKSSLASSSAISSLVARGRRDAAFLTLHARAESEERRSGLLGWPALWDQIEKPTEDVQREAEQGYAPAQFNLGWRYDNRYLGVPGVGQDYAEAARWYRRAADQGLAPAQFNLGVMYDMGEGVGRDYAQAARWYRKAAEQCVAPAQFNLGIKYENGEGVAQDATEAVAWYRKAGFAAAGNFNLVPVRYSVDAQKRELRNIFDQCSSAISATGPPTDIDICANEIVNALALHANLFKDPIFEPEKEWRIIIETLPGRSDLCFRSSADKVIPYMKTPKLPVASITIGAAMDQEASAAGVRALLDKKRYNKVKILAAKPLISLVDLPR